MGCCCASRKYENIDSTNNLETNAVAIQCDNNSDQNEALLQVSNQSNQNISHSNDNNNNNHNNDTQQLLPNNTNNDYLSTGHSPPTPLINKTTLDEYTNNDIKDKDENEPLISSNMTYGQCQTPPILKTLFGGTQNLSDHMLDDDDINNDTNNDTHITPMGGNVYMGFANNERPLLFNNNNDNNNRRRSNSDSNDRIDSDNDSNMNRSKSYNNSSNQSDSSDWNPRKPGNNPPVLMGFVNKNETVSFNQNVNVLNNMEDDYIIKKNKAINYRFDNYDEEKSHHDDDNGDQMEETEIFSNRYINNKEKKMNIDSMLLFGNDDSRFTESNMSLNSAQMADIVINDNIIRQRSNISNSSTSSSSYSLRSNASNTSLSSSKMELIQQLIYEEKEKNNKFDGDTPQFSLQNGNDYALISSFMIATFNVFIEYFPYKNIMEDIFLFCNIDINDPVFVHCNLDFEFPDTSELESKYNYYDVPDLYIENVSITNRKQPSLVLMIGAPGSGKTSYANYRYGANNVIAADDYFEIHHQGQFIGTQISEAHEYCQQEVLKKLYKLETVVVANTHSDYWQLYEKIIPVIFDNSLTHKIVFAVMPETNPTTLVRRCVHSCTKPKIIHYTQNIQIMLKNGNGISSHIILKYGNKKPDDMIDEEYNNKYNDRSRGRYNNYFDYGLWIDAEGYHSLQDWFQHYTNTNLLHDLGDGRISPIIQESWPNFKKTFKKWMNLSKFNSEDDPVIDLEVRIIGYSNHGICQMVNIEIIKSSINIFNKDSMDNRFWNMFENGVNIDGMGCVLAMKKGIPFSNAKLLFDYNCIQYIDDGPIVKAKLTTKRYVRNYIKYFTPPPLINDINVIANTSNNIFFSLEGISTSHELLGKNKQKSDSQGVVDKSSFSLNVLEKHNNNGTMDKLINEIKQNDENNHLNPNAKEFTFGVNNKLSADATEFKMETNDSLNPTAMEFQPQPIQQPSMQFIPQLNNQWYSQNHVTNTNMINTNNFIQQTQQNIPWDVPLQNNNNDTTTTLNADATEFKMDENNDSLNPSANQFKFASITSSGFPSSILQPNGNQFQPQQQQQQMTVYNDNLNENQMQLPTVQQQQQPLQTQINPSPQTIYQQQQQTQTWDVPLNNNNNNNSFNPNATTFTPNITTNGIQQPLNTYNNIPIINNNKTNPFNTISLSEQPQIDYSNMAAYNNNNNNTFNS